MNNSAYTNLLNGLGIVVLVIIIFSWFALSAMSYNGCEPNNFAGYEPNGQIICIGGLNSN